MTQLFDVPAVPFNNKFFISPFPCLNVIPFDVTFHSHFGFKSDIIVDQ